MAALPDELLAVDWGPDKVRTLIKAFGRWPLHVFSLGELPRTLPSCPCCGQAEVEVIHLFGECVATGQLYSSWASSPGYAVIPGIRLPWSVMRVDLFADRVAFVNPDSMDVQGHIRYECQAVKSAATYVSNQSSSKDFDALLAASGVVPEGEGG